MRLILLKEGLEQEINVEMQQAKLQLFASLAHGPTGKILAGNLTEIRFSSYEDYIQALAPYTEIKKEAPEDAKTEEEKRMDFIEIYKEWVKAGAPGPGGSKESEGSKGTLSTKG